MKNSIYLVFDISPMTNTRFRVIRAKNRLMPIKGTKTKKYSEELREMARQQWGNSKPLDGPLKVEIIFFIPRPKSIKKRKYPHTKPDLDNLEKELGDALQGIVFVNDSRIVTKTVSKQYAHEGRIELKIRVLR